MRVVRKSILAQYCRRHADVRLQIGAWLKEVEHANWLTPHDVGKRYPRARFIGDTRVVFKLRGNKYRLDIKINFKSQIVLVMRIGTHEEYGRWQF